MENFTPFSALAGGGLIGLAAAALLLLQGRIAGISGILNGILEPATTDRGWRLAFLAGLIAGAVIVIQLQGLPFVPRTTFPLPLLLAGGFLVGFGTRMGSGCTSGHGVCGMARISPRSIVATVTFLAIGMLTATVLHA